jgi:hypothetical protein
MDCSGTYSHSEKKRGRWNISKSPVFPCPYSTISFSDSSNLVRRSVYFLTVWHYYCWAANSFFWIRESETFLAAVSKVGLLESLCCLCFYCEKFSNITKMIKIVLCYAFSFYQKGSNCVFSGWLVQFYVVSDCVVFDAKFSMATTVHQIFFCWYDLVFIVIFF